jgi:hypothetical protein
MRNGGGSGEGGDQGNKEPPTRITEELILYYTDCKRLGDVKVVALRERNLH